MAEGWGDGDAFAAPFAATAEFVDVRGRRHHGRDEIARGHRALFAGPLRGSRMSTDVAAAWSAADGVVVARIEASLEVPGGPLGGRHASVMTVVLGRRDGGWQVVSAHNTPRGPRRGVLKPGTG